MPRLVLPGADIALRRAHVGDLVGGILSRTTPFEAAGLVLRDGETAALASVALIWAWPRMGGVLSRRAPCSGHAARGCQKMAKPAAGRVWVSPLRRWARTSRACRAGGSPLDQRWRVEA